MEELTSLAFHGELTDVSVTSKPGSIKCSGQWKNRWGLQLHSQGQHWLDFFSGLPISVPNNYRSTVRHTEGAPVPATGLLRKCQVPLVRQTAPLPQLYATKLTENLLHLRRICKIHEKQSRFLRIQKRVTGWSHNRKWCNWITNCLYTILKVPNCGSLIWVPLFSSLKKKKDGAT